MSYIFVSNFRTWGELRDSNHDYLFSYPQFNEQCIIHGLPLESEINLSSRVICEKVKAKVSNNFTECDNGEYLLVNLYPEKVLEELYRLGYEIVSCVSKQTKSNTDFHHEEMVWTLLKKLL